MFHDHNNFKDFPSFNSSHKSIHRATNSIFGMGCLVVICNIVIAVLIIMGLIAGYNYVKQNGLRNIGNAIMDGEGTNTVETTN